MTDWAATGAMLSGIGTVGSAVAIILAGLLGRQAVANYRKQKQAEREIEHAEKALAAAYKIQSAMSTIRSPLTTAAESADSMSELIDKDWFIGLNEGKKSRSVQANVFYERIRHFQDDFDEAISVIPFVKAYFGLAASDALRDLVHCRHSVRVYSDAYARDECRDPAYSLKIESYIWEGAAVDEGKDPIDERVKADLAALEGVLFPIIRSNSTTSISTIGSGSSKHS